jgi:putative acetyltransferase
MLPFSFSHLKIRTASNEDIPSIKKLVFGVLEEFDLLPDPETTDADLNDIEGNYLRRGGLFELIEDYQGSLKGTVGVFPMDANTCELRKMYFAPEIRGSGLGKFILQRVINRAKELGFARMVLETSSKLPAAKRLYEGFGFRPFVADHPAPRSDQSYGLDLID